MSNIQVRREELRKCDSLLSNSRHTEAWTVGWGFSSRCDLRCPFCYSSEVRQKSKTPEFEITEAEEFLVRNGEYIQAINFGTGECFLSPTFPILLQLCGEYAPQAKVAVTTNGAFADLSKGSFAIAARQISECDVSLDFHNREMHDEWRGKNGAWERAKKAIQLAVDHGLTTSVVMLGAAQTLTEDNICGMLKLCETHKVALRVNIYMPTTGDYSFIPTAESVYLALVALKAWGASVCSSDRLIGSILNAKENQPATGPKRSCRILPNGNVSPSTYLINMPWLIQSNLTDITLAELLNTGPFQRYLTPPIPRDCEQCSMLQSCGGGSIERRWLWGRSLESPDPLCPNMNGNKSNLLSGLPEDVTMERWDGPTIHLDYLPTIVALPPS